MDDVEATPYRRTFNVVLPEPLNGYDPADGEEVTYVIRCGQFVKIGKTRNVPARVRDLMSATPFDLTVIAVFPGGYVMEKHLHRKFSTCHHRDEWFRLEGELEAWIGRGCPYRRELTIALAARRRREAAAAASSLRPPRIKKKRLAYRRQPFEPIAEFNGGREVNRTPDPYDVNVVGGMEPVEK